MKSTYLIFTAALAVPATALAHPGHAGVAAAGWVHFLTDPYHLVLGALPALALVAVVRTRNRRLRSRTQKPSR